MDTSHPPRALREILLDLAARYGAATKRAPSTVSALVLGGGKVLDRIAAGGDLSTGNFEKAVHWFDAHWPAGVDWPQGLARPSLSVDPARSAPAAIVPAATVVTPTPAGADEAPAFSSEERLTPSAAQGAPHLPLAGGGKTLEVA